MGIIKAVTQAVGGAFADQWLEVIEADNMGDQTVFTKGTLIRRGENKKGTDNVVSNGSMIHVYDNQFMMLVDGGKIVDYTAEPGYTKWIILPCRHCSTDNWETPSRNRLTVSVSADRRRRNSRYFLSICRKSKALSSEQDSQSIILIRSIRPNCFCVHMAHIRLKL